MKPLFTSPPAIAPLASLRAVTGVDSLAAWRDVTRPLILGNVPPESIHWLDPHNPQAEMPLPSTPRNGSLTTTSMPETPASAPSAAFTVPRSYMHLATLALCHRDPARWGTLYHVLWRLTHGQSRLLADAADEDVHNLHMLAKAVKRDAHKMKAFVRFRRVETRNADGATNEHYIAWHRPDYRILPIVGPFFARRFGVMKWTILTPYGSAIWDGEALTYGPPATRREAPTADTLEDMWRTYYASVFNPARINPRAMQREMPVRYWGTLPEAEIIDDLLKRAPTRVDAMLGTTVGSEQGAAAFIPRTPNLTLPQLRQAAMTCRGCDLCERATQTVFGEGPEHARIMLIGEQPGDQEDLQGRPFVGPAGEVLDNALHHAGLDRSQLYITNAVKHFKWTPDPRGKRRLHSSPNVLEMRACRAWLEKEIELVNPSTIVLLGATAGRSLLGASFRVTTMRSRVLMDTPFAPRTVVATIHPSAILRQPDHAAKDREFAAMVNDLRLATIPTA